MLDALYVAASGMHAELTQLDVISNNLANLNTAAFKRSTVSFDDLVYRDAVSSSSALDRVYSQMQVGMGSGVAAISRDFSSADLIPTGNPLDLAIQGQGFMEVVLGNGEYAFTRNGALRIDSDGYLETTSGHRLANNIQIPPDATDIYIAETGEVRVRIEDEQEFFEVGQIELANFINPSSLEAIGENLFIATDDSSGLMIANPGETGFGKLAQGFMESSNVNLVNEMMTLVVTQRAYEVNSQVIRAVDEMLRINNSLRS